MTSYADFIYAKETSFPAHWSASRVNSLIIQPENNRNKFRLILIGHPALRTKNFFLYPVKINPVESNGQN